MEMEKCDINITADNVSDIEQRLIALIRTRPKGISNKDLTSEMDLKPFQMTTIINKLLSQGNIELFKQGQSLFYRFKDSTKLVKGSTNEEKIVYKIIEEIGTKGIWIGDIRKKTNLIHTQLQKILKNLEAKQFIKAVKSVTNNRKMYLLYHLEPDVSITGSVWYQDRDIEMEFVDVLYQQCYRFLEEKKKKAVSHNTGPLTARKAMIASSEEIWKFISKLGVSKVQLSIKDIEMILNILIYDNKIEQIRNDTLGNDKKLYKSIQPLMKLPGLMGNPCGICPVKEKCYDKGLYTPINCQYLKEWLE